MKSFHLFAISAAILASQSTHATAINLPARQSVSKECPAAEIPKEILSVGKDHVVIYKKDVKIFGYSRVGETFDVELVAGSRSVTYGLSPEEIAVLFDKDACFPAYVHSWSCDKPVEFEGMIAGGLCYDHIKALFPFESNQQDL